MFSAHDSQERRKSMRMEDNAETTSEIIFAEKLYFSMYRIKDKYTEKLYNIYIINIHPIVFYSISIKIRML